ncbi:hypothetical protein Bca52824_006597 [Brassica carinata]|uniref:Protein kinase domain-containing protein n=1 Tax=Brassica carinata TaxID=52824 RepID=A0A8X7W691_BRACI|nr:hypothetical protein Bca52824_006597 [Brassica carinata]
MNTKTYNILCIIASVLTLLISNSSAATPPNSNSSSSCSRTCGGISIPFPFGIGGKDCYLNNWYEVVCNSTSGSGITVPFLSRLNMEVVNIILPDYQPYGVVHVKGPVTSLGCSGNTSQELKKSLPDLNVTGKGSPYFITEENRVMAVGCGTKALVTNIESEILGCESVCDVSKSSEEVTDMICDGYKCCQARIPSERPQVIGVNVERSNGTRGEGCSVAFLTNQSYSYFYGISYRNCYCANGFAGNPFIQGGCIDVDQCKGSHTCGDDTCVNLDGTYRCEPKLTKTEKPPVLTGVLIGLLGLLFLVVGVFGLFKLIIKQRRIIRSRKFFKRNGGLLLKQQLTTKDGNVEMSRIFSSNELEKATDNFSVDRVLGQGGQGTVYKGMLVDGRIVAVKRSKVVDEDKLEEFINEVVLLSQINHRDIVKLMGCCLETEVPILVYEYIPNGDLFKLRLRIAIEIAGALSYMHSATSFPIFHRDIKSANILLDEKYRAKVSDFGNLRSITIDQTHLTTLVAGTFGYMDPEYFLSSQYTHKSDVYSFGVVLVELITGEKAVSRVRSEEGRGLATHFLEAMKENRVIDIVDVRIKEENNLDQVMGVTKLAQKCLSRKGKKRPSMTEVSTELERIHSPPKDSELHIENKDDNQLMEINRK